jgi:hypothetical protein
MIWVVRCKGTRITRSEKSCDFVTQGFQHGTQCKLTKREVLKRLGIRPAITTQGHMCWVCVIFFARVVVSERLRRARGGVRGGCRGAGPPRGGSGAAPPNFFFFWADILFGPTYFRDDIFPGPHDIRWFSAHGFCRWFSISG